MTPYINATSSPNKHCQHLCIFSPSTSFHLPPTRPLKNKTHTSCRWNDCCFTKHTSTFYLFAFQFPFQTFHIYSMHPLKVIVPLWSWIISRYLMELIQDKKGKDRRHKLRTKVEIVFESPICQTLKALSLILEMALYPKINLFRHLPAEMNLPIE